MFAQWLDEHAEAIFDSYVVLRRERGDTRPEKVIRGEAMLLLNTLTLVLRGEADGAAAVESASRQALTVGSTLEALTEAAHSLYTLIRQLLEQEQPEQHLEWLGMLGDYMLIGSQAATKALESNLDAQVTERTKEAAIFRALADNAVDAISLVGLNNNTLYANPAFYTLHGFEPNAPGVLERPVASFILPESFARLGLSPDEIIAKMQEPEGFRAEFQHVRADGSTFPGEDTTFAIRDEDGQVIAFGNILRDVSERKQAETEQEHLQRKIIRAQQSTLEELSTPIIPIMDNIIIMPIIGSIDTMRARNITRALLAGISAHRAKVAILDITGVPIVDTGVAQHLNKTIQAARLKGARTIITGVSDAVAETIVDLGIDWSEVTTLRDLQTGLLAALQSMGLAITRNDK